MARAVDVFETLERRDYQTLGTWFQKRQRPNEQGELVESVHFRRMDPAPHGAMQYIASPDIRPELWNLIRHEDFDRPETLRRAVLMYLQLCINQQLESHSCARVIYDPHPDRAERDRIRLFVYPTSLLGAMWIQFARVCEGSATLRRCENCGKWFEVSLEDTGKRRSAKFCSDKCRVESYRDRKQRAISLHDQGMSLDDIAITLKTRPATVQGWLAR
jgi:predicted nucleic acid-binding Zn ribbon protein